MAPEIEQILQKSLDHIEENLCARLTLRELSREAGFSCSHYARLFRAATGMSVMRYMTRRRLLHAAYAIQNGMDTISAAMAYGFDTYAGYYKAFCREYGCAPTRYLQTHRAAAPGRVNLKEENRMVEIRQLERVLEAWGLQQEKIGRIYYQNTGHCSESAFSVGDGYILKCSASLGNLGRQVALHQSLQGLTAPVIPAPDGRMLVSDGEMDFVLFGRIEGEPLNARQALVCPESLASIGQGLARLHEGLRGCDPVLCVSENLMTRLREWAIPAAQKAMQLEEKWIGEYLDRMEKLYPELPVQIIHHDPNPDNILCREGKVAVFLDFDLSRISPRIFDLAYAATGILSVTFDAAQDTQNMAFFEAAHALWRGYDGISPLTDAERQALPDMVIAIQLICVAAFSGREKLAQLARINQDMLRMILAHESALRSVVWQR